VSYIPFVLKSWVDFFRQGYFDKVNIVGGASLTVVSMTMGDKAAEDRVTFQMRTGTGGTVVVGSMAISTALSKGWVREDIADSPTVFKPRPEGLAVSRFYVDRETLSHGE
jgi:hypothetical protein